MDAFNEYVKLDRNNEAIRNVRVLISAYVSRSIVDMYVSRDYDYSFYEKIDREMKEKHVIVDDGGEFDNLKDLANYLADEEERVNNLPCSPMSEREYKQFQEYPDIYFALNYGIGDIDDFVEMSNRRYREYEKRLGVSSDIDD